MLDWFNIIVIIAKFGKLKLYGNRKLFIAILSSAIHPKTEYIKLLLQQSGLNSSISLLWRLDVELKIS